MAYSQDDRRFLRCVAHKCNMERRCGVYAPCRDAILRLTSLHANADRSEGLAQEVDW